MRYLSLNEVLELYQRIMQQSGGLIGVRDLGALEAALGQPRATYDQQELYPTVVDKAATLGFSLIGNHPFVDGNKRIGHAAMELFLMLNGYEIGNCSAICRQELKFPAKFDKPAHGLRN